METTKHGDGSFFSKFRGAFTKLLYILKLVWDTNRFLLVGLVLISILEGVLPLLNAFIARQLINNLAMIIGSGSLEDLKHILSLLILQLIYLIAARATSQFKGTLVNLSGEMVTSHIRVTIAEKTKEIDLANFDRPEFYEKLENANREASSRPISILTATLALFSSMISTFSFVLLLGALHPLIPVAIFIMGIPTAVINFKYRKITFNYVKSHSLERRKMSYFSATPTNRDQAKEIKLLSLHDTFIERYLEAFDAYFIGIRRIFIREDILHVIVYTLSTIFNTAFFLYVAYRVCFTGLHIGDYTLYTGALTSVLSGVSALVSNSAKIYEGTLFIDNMLDFMNMKPTIVPAVCPAVRPKKGVPHTIEFRHVSFSYPDIEHKVIDDLNLVLQGGKSYALVGLNGAGKTTLIKLMTRLYDPTEGEILLDGINIKNYDVQELYAMFGIIFQDFSKYAVTVRENITFGDIRAPYDEERLKYAIKESAAEEFVSRLPDGYDTLLTRMFERNAFDLSIGQWQKISIARAFYKDSEILILDEPTASLDPMAEADIFRQFNQLRNGKTTLFVSHRLSSATDADQIIVMQHGKIIEEGGHKELMEKNGTYCKLFTLQAEKYLENS